MKFKDQVNLYKKLNDELSTKIDEWVLVNDELESNIGDYSTAGSKSLAEQILDGSLTEFSAVKAGVKSLASYRFYNFKNLAKVDFTGLTEIPQYLCYNCPKLTEIVLPETITKVGSYSFYNCSSLAGDLVFNNASIESYAFINNTKITSISGSLSSTGSYSFSSLSSLKKIDLKINGSIGSDSFSSIQYLDSLNIDKDNNITELGSYSFSSLGRYRSNPEFNIFDLDFSNSTFKAINSSSFYYNKYTNIIFPESVSSINSSAFAYSQYLNLYYNSLPTLSSTNVFSSATNYKNFFPYNLVQSAKTATNWSSSSILATIAGYAPANQFQLNEELPISDLDGYELTWYDDIEMTNQVSVVSDPAKIYYCQSGEKVFIRVLKITEFQAKCTISDDSKIYAQDSLIKVGSVVKITAVGEGSNTQAYQFKLNGTDITSGYEYTVGNDPISIVCIYWDGVNVPVNPVFSENTPAQIKVGIDTGVGKTLWNIGDTIPITLTDGTEYNLILYDMSENRYEKADGSGYSNCVIGFVELLGISAMNSTNTSAGGWAESKMYKETMATKYELLPDDWKSVISEVKIASTVGGGSYNISYSNNKLFLPAYAEFFPNITSSGYKDEGYVYDYFVGTSSGSDVKRVKYQKGSTSASWYWLRSPVAGNSTYFRSVYSDGNWSSILASYSYGCPACFAI